jgi:hypothetical protein
MNIFQGIIIGLISGALIFIGGWFAGAHHATDAMTAASEQMKATIEAENKAKAAATAAELTKVRAKLDLAEHSAQAADVAKAAAIEEAIKNANAAAKCGATKTQIDIMNTTIKGVYK